MVIQVRVDVRRGAEIAVSQPLLNLLHLFDDMDIITFLYSDVYLNQEHPYHFCHWNDQQFYMESGE